jgi:hypothetical protein
LLARRVKSSFLRTVNAQRAGFAFRDEQNLEAAPAHLAKVMFAAHDRRPQPFNGGRLPS